MKSWTMTLSLGALFLFCVSFSSSAMAKTTGTCLECHSQRFTFNDSSNLFSLAQIENRNVFQARLNPCPGVRILTQETFLTESRIVHLNRMVAAQDQEGTVAGTWRQKIGEAGEAFSRMKTESDGSASRFLRENAALRTGLQKVYDQAFQMRAESDRRWLIGISGILLLLLFVFAGIGYRKLSGFSKKILVLALITGSLSFSACTQGSLETKPKSPAQESLDQAQKVASRLSANVEDSFYTSGLLARLGGDWARVDSKNGEQAFQLAWQMAVKTRDEASQAARIQKIVEQWPTPAEASRQKVNYDAVLNLSDELKGLEGRTWALRTIAEEWVQINRKKGREALDSATREAQGIKDAEIRDLELKAIAEAWAGIDEGRSLDIARALQNPFLKSISLAAVARVLKKKEIAGGLFQESWKLAETITPESLRIYALSKISVLAAAAEPQAKGDWAKRAEAKTKELKDPLLRIYALQELVSFWATTDWEQAARWAEEIPPNQPEARAFALIRVGENRGVPKAKAEVLLNKALAETDQMEDGFQTQKARALILTAMTELNPREAARSLPRIGDRILRSEVENRIAIQMAAADAEKALEIADKIPDEFIRSRAILTILSKKLPGDMERMSALYREAMQAGLSISEPYSRAWFLIELGKSWSRLDKAREGAAYDLAAKAAGEISLPSLKAEVLEALSAAWKGSNKAKAQSLIDGMDPGVLQARKMVEEAKLWAKTDFGKAKQMAEAIPAVYPFEKAQACREIANSVKKSQPDQALGLFEKAWGIIVALPEGSSREKILAQILNDAAPLNPDKAYAMVKTVSDRLLKDVLLKEAGNALLKEESPRGLIGALKLAKEISEGSTRTALYQKITEKISKGMGKSEGTDQAVLSSLTQWGLARETARREETEAAPYYEKAYLEAGKISDVRERAFILSGMIGDWAQIDEAKALGAAEKISADFPEPLSYSHLQVSVRIGKWNRKEAEKAFEKTLSAAELIQDPSLKMQRLMQIGQQWQAINKEKGKAILKKTDGLPKGLYHQAKAVLDSSKVIYKETIDKNIKILEKTNQLFQGRKNLRILTDMAVVWAVVDPVKAQEILAQIDSKEARVNALRQMAQQQAKVQPEVSKAFLEKATQEALSMAGLGERIPALDSIGRDLVGLDLAKARATYLMAYQAAERANSTTPKF